MVLSQMGAPMDRCDTKAQAGIDLHGCDLSRQDLSDVNLQGPILRAVNLSAAKLRGANLSKTDLRDAQLLGSDLQSVDFSDADLRGAFMTKAQLGKNNFEGALLEGA